MVRRGVKGGVPLVAAGLLVGCAEQRFRLGFESDTQVPTVAVVKSAGDTIDLQVARKVSFTISATDNLGLKTIAISLRGGLLLDTTITFTSATTTIDLVVDLPQGVNSTVGGVINITATATDGNNNSATATASIFVVNLRALTVVLFSPTVGSVTSPDKQLPIRVLAAQQAGIQRVGWQAIGVVNAIDSAFYALPDTVNLLDTLTIPTATPAGTFIIWGCAVASAGRRVVSTSVTVTVQLVVTDTIPPIVTFTVPQRAEVRDSITVRAKDPSGITSIGWIALNAAGTEIGGRTTAFAGTLTDVTVMDNLSLSLTAAQLPALVILKAFATDAAGNSDSARTDTLRTVPVLADSITVVNGITKPLPAGGHVVDAIYNRNNNRVYLTNFDLDRVEVFDVTDTSFKAAMPVGSRPWGIALWPRDTLGANGDTVVVANSGGTDLSIVDVSLGRERRRHALPNFLIQSVEVEITNALVVPPALKLKVTEFDFSDRPQYLAMTCRVTAGTACSATDVMAVYSTAPTQAQQGAFPLRGTMRWENLTSAVPESHFWWEQAEKLPSPDNDTIQVIVDRGPLLGTDILLGASCGRTVNMIELGFVDSTFTRNSGNFTHALIGEGGSSKEPSLEFARALTYNVSVGKTVTVCPVINLAGVLFSGREEIDNGISPGIRVRDFIVNTAIPVRSIGVNFNGLTNLFRADSVYVFDEGLRLRGIIGASGANAGMDLNFNHSFQAGTGGTPGTSGGTLSPDDRLSFLASTDPQIDVFDTFFWGKVASIPIRDPVIGPLRVARLGSGEQILIGVTARGVVTVRIPALTNLYPANRWSGSQR